MLLHPFLSTLPYALKENLGFKFALTSSPLLNGNSINIIVGKHQFKHVYSLKKRDSKQLVFKNYRKLRSCSGYCFIILYIFYIYKKMFKFLMILINLILIIDYLFIFRYIFIYKVKSFIYNINTCLGVCLCLFVSNKRQNS